MNKDSLHIQIAITFMIQAGNCGVKRTFLPVCTMLRQKLKFSTKMYSE